MLMSNIIMSLTKLSSDLSLDLNSRDAQGNSMMHGPKPPNHNHARLKKASIFLAGSLYEGNQLLREDIDASLHFM